jgi:bifunctional DNA-binding transcriptional regulator/antitoxin component of YhaV-PrlF toxin-antitoxin module
LGQEITTVNKANAEGSYKTTVPHKIAKELGLEYGDKLAWYLEEEKGKSGKKYVIVKKVEF